MELHENISKKLSALKNTKSCDSCKLTISQDFIYFIIGLRPKLDKLQISCTFRNYLPLTANVPETPIPQCKLCGKKQTPSALSQFAEEISEFWFFDFIHQILRIQFKDLSKKMWQLLDICRQIDVKSIQNDLVLLEETSVQTEEQDVSYKHHFGKIASIVNIQSHQPESIIRAVEGLKKLVKVYETTNFNQIIKDLNDEILVLKQEISDQNRKISHFQALYKQQLTVNYTKEVIDLKRQVSVKNQQMEKLHQSQTFSERKTLLNEFARSQRPLQSIDEFKQSFSPKKMQKTLKSSLSRSGTREIENSNSNQFSASNFQILEQELARLNVENEKLTEKVSKLEETQYRNAKSIGFAVSVSKNVKTDQKTIKTQKQIITDQLDEIDLYQTNIHVLLAEIVSLHDQLAKTRKNANFAFEKEVSPAFYVGIFKEILSQLRLSEYTQERISEHFRDVRACILEEKFVENFTFYSGVSGMDLIEMKRKWNESSEIFITNLVFRFKEFDLLKGLTPVSGFQWDFGYEVGLQFNVVCAILSIFGLETFEKKGYGVPWLVGEIGSFEGVEI